MEKVKEKDKEVADQVTTDVVIVGAGMSGLAAADLLHRNGIDVVVLEASHRLVSRVVCVRRLRQMGAVLVLTAWSAAGRPVGSSFRQMSRTGQATPRAGPAPVSRR